MELSIADELASILGDDDREDDIERSCEDDCNPEDDRDPPKATSVIDYQHGVRATTISAKPVKHDSELVKPVAHEDKSDQEAKQSELKRAFKWDGSAMQDLELEDQIRELSRQRGTDGKRLDYQKIRTSMLMASFELNRRQVTAPVFRGLRRTLPVAVKTKMTKDDRLLVCDRQIIDLHWLHCAGWKGVVAGKPDLATLFTAKEFDVDLAEGFASTRMPVQEKVEWLNLPPDLAHQMCALKNKSMTERENDVLKGVESRRQAGYDSVFNTLLGKAGATGADRERATIRARIWACDRIAGGDPALARKVLAKWGGIVVDPSNFPKRLKAVKNALKRAGRLSDGQPVVTSKVTD